MSKSNSLVKNVYNNILLPPIYQNLLDLAWLNRFLYFGVFNRQITASRFLNHLVPDYEKSLFSQSSQGLAGIFVCSLRLISSLAQPSWGTARSLTKFIESDYINNNTGLTDVIYIIVLTVLIQWSPSTLIIIPA